MGFSIDFLKIYTDVSSQWRIYVTLTNDIVVSATEQVIYTAIVIISDSIGGLQSISDKNSETRPALISQML